MTDQNDGSGSNGPPSPGAAPGSGPASPSPRQVPRVRRTQEQRSAETRALLLDVTISCLAELGYAKTTAQVIDDTEGKTLASACSLEKNVKELPKFEDKVALANHVGKLIGERAIEKGIKKVVFDRNGFLYHGRVKAVSDGAREAGLNF